MSICMPLGKNSHRPESGVVTPLRPDPSKRRAAGASPDDRIGDLEARLERLETGHVTALNLVRQALSTLKETQTEQTAAQAHAISRLTAQLGECETALTRLDAARKRDDEAMRERLFDMGEALESVRATAAAAVRPAGLRKLERSLAREMDERAAALRAELGERITERVEAAESRSAEALDTLESSFWDDMTEIARRFDYLADTVREVRRETEHQSATEAGPESLPETGGDADPQADEDILELTEIVEEPHQPGGGSESQPSGIIPFPPQPVRQTGTDMAHPPHDIGTLLSAAARRAGETEAESGDAGDERACSEHTLNPFRRLATSASSAVMAVCIMSGLSLLAGPALGPGLQGAMPAFAHDRAEWTPVKVAPQPIAITPRLTPILRTAEKTHPVRREKVATSDR